MGIGRGVGYYNIAPMDAHIHSLSAKGVKSYHQEVTDKQMQMWRKGTLDWSEIQQKFNAKGEKVTCSGCGNVYDWGDIDARHQHLTCIVKHKKLNAKGSFSAETVFEQLGGNKFRVMTGAKDFYRNDDKQEIGFRIGRNAKNVNYVRIRLNGKDLYDMEFLQIRKFKIKVKSKETDVYADQLQELFTANTGMDTHL